MGQNGTEYFTDLFFDFFVGQNGTERDRMGQNETEWDKRFLGLHGTQWDTMGQNGTQWDVMGHNGTKKACIPELLMYNYSYS